MKNTWIIAWGATLLAPTLATAAPGDLFVTESEGGSVLEFSDGGDLSKAERFATGLSAPIGICVGPEGHIYVSESATGQITVIDDGGDLTDAEPYADGLTGIGSLWCDDERIIISCPLCSPNGVIEISGPGPIVQNVSIIGLNFPLPGDLVFDAEGELLVAASNVYELTQMGADYSAIDPFTTGVAMLAAVDFDGTLLGGEFGANRIFDFSAGGELGMQAPWATLPDIEMFGVQSLLYAPDDGAYALLGDEIYALPEGGGDLTLAAPFASGLNTGLDGLQGMQHHVCSSNADCADDDLCNGDELCMSNECFPPQGPPECDDDNVCTADSCDAIEGCLNEPVAGCCLVDLDCAVDELCDVGTNVCVPTTVPPSEDGGGDDTSGGPSEDGDDGDDDDDDGGDDGDDGGLGTGGGTAVGDGTDESGGEAGASADDSGCSCRSEPSDSPWPVLSLFALLIARRRRMGLGS